MDAIRWIFILIAVGTAAAAALWVGLSEPPKPALAAEPVPVAATAAAPSAPPVASVPASPVPVAPVAIAVPTPRPAARPSAPRIGSEGYGPHIERAAAGGDPAAAMEALQWLQACESNAGRRQSVELLRNQGVSPELMTQLMQEADAEARRCQTVTAAHQALVGPLALQAMRGGVRGAAAKYAGATPAQDVSPALRQEVLDTLRRDARSGHAGSLMDALVVNDAWGLSDTERLGYVFAYGELTGKSGQILLQQLMKNGSVRFKAPPTTEQLDAAKAAGQQIVAQLRAKA